jgi:hypothetical protein
VVFVSVAGFDAGAVPGLGAKFGRSGDAVVCGGAFAAGLAANVPSGDAGFDCAGELATGCAATPDPAPGTGFFTGGGVTPVVDAVVPALGVAEAAVPGAGVAGLSGTEGRR